MDTNEARNLLNQVYSKLESKRSLLIQTLAQSGFTASSGYYNGHYFKDEAGNYIKDAFPIPVITVDRLCDIEINLDTVSVSTKLTRTDALAFDYSKLASHPFEAYGVQDYLADFYVAGMTLDQLRTNIQASTETEIGFSFSLKNTEDILNFILFLQAEGFYY